MTDKDKKDESAAVNEARQADKGRPEAEKDAVAANPHRDNVNPHAYSEESARKPGDITTYSINEPGPDAPQPFKVPEDHTVTTPETLEQAYPDGYVAPEPVTQSEHNDPSNTEHPRLTGDPDELEDEIDQAEEEGDFKPMHKSSSKSPAKRK